MLICTSRFKFNYGNWSEPKKKEFAVASQPENTSVFLSTLKTHNVMLTLVERKKEVKKEKSAIVHQILMWIQAVKISPHFQVQFVFEFERRCAN